MYKIEEIFPIPVYKSELHFTNQQIQFIKNADRNDIKNNYGNYVSSNQYILECPELSDLKQQCQHHFDVYFRNVMGVGDDCSLRITQSWVNYNEQGSSHHTHHHPNSIISGVFYITDNPSSLVFMRNQNKCMLEPNIIDYNKYNTMYLKLKVERCMIILFPSYINHGVDVNEYEEQRISVAMNSFYRGNLGSYISSTELGIS